MSCRTPIPNLTRAAQALFVLNTIVWIALGIESLLHLDARQPVPPIVALVIALLMFGNAGAMLLAALGLGQRKRLFVYFASALIAINIVLTVTDQFGALDLATLVIDVILLGLLAGLLRQR